MNSSPNENSKKIFTLWQALGFIVASFGAGFGAYRLMLEATDQTTILKTRQAVLEAKAMCLDKLSKSNFDPSVNIPECKDFIEEVRVNISGEIGYPPDNSKVTGNITVTGNLSLTEATTGKLLKNQTQAWLLATNNNKDCYVQGYIPTLDSSFEQETSSIRDPKKYTIYLLATDDKTINQDLSTALGKKIPEIGCSDVKLSDFKVDQVIVDNSSTPPNPSPNGSVTSPQPTESSTGQPFNLATNYGSKYGGITVNKDTANQRITLSGTFSSAAGYSIENDPNLSSLNGQQLALQINGTGNNQNKLFKLEVNDQVINPTEPSRVSSVDPDFITVQDGTVRFQLPPTVNKLNFVFFDATLNNLTISATVSD